MRNFIFFLAMLVGYTFVYAGVSRFWSGVTLSPGSSGTGSTFGL